jgi:serine/threonine protein kinase
MESANEPMLTLEMEELFPRWFETQEACDESCFVCVRMKQKRSFERGTYGVVTPCDNHVTKVITSTKHVTCQSALREIAAYALMGTECDQITRYLQPPATDASGNMMFTLEQAHGSLLHFARCVKVRHTVPGFEHMSVHFVLWSLLRAVTHMNKCHLVHRDIKPGNILVFAGPRITLCDFGGCRMVSKSLQDLDADMSDTVCTRNYAPPEEVKGHHSYVFDSFSVAATVIHYTMSFAPNYKALNKVNRRTFTKLCKPYPGLLTLIRMLCRCDPKQRYTAEEALLVFEDLYPHLVRKYKAFLGPTAVPCSPSRLKPMSTTCSWERFHNFTYQVWPCLLEAIRVCNGDNVVDGHSPLAVAFYTLNMLQNMHSKVEFKPCTEIRCYVMVIPCFVRAAFLLVGCADDTDSYLQSCHDLFQRTGCRCVVMHNAHSEAVYASQLVFDNAPDWMYPESIHSLVELQEALHL